MTARPPFTPFADGSPKFQPGLRRIEPVNWLLPDTEADIALEAKAKLFAERPNETFVALAGSEPGQKEACSLVEQALGQVCSPTSEPGLLAASRLVSDDLCLMERQGEHWVLRAASLAAPTHFSLADTLGKSLENLHQPVPDGTPALAGKISKMFDQVPPGAVFERFNWTIQLGNTRFMPDAAPMRAQALLTAPEQASKVLHLRVERQTILRLPKTLGVLFCIRICIDPLRNLSAAQAKQLFTAWAEADEHVRGYKKWAVFDRLMVHFVDNFDFSKN